MKDHPCFITLKILFLLAMDLNSLMGGFMGMAGMNMGVHPFMQFLNQGGLHPNFAAGLAGLF